MTAENVGAYINILLLVCVPIFCFGAVLALISIDKYIQKMEKHLEEISESIAYLTRKQVEGNVRVNNDRPW